MSLCRLVDGAPPSHQARARARRRVTDGPTTIARRAVSPHRAVRARPRGTRPRLFDPRALSTSWTFGRAPSVDNGGSFHGDAFRHRGPRSIASCSTGTLLFASGPERTTFVRAAPAFGGRRLGLAQIDVVANGSASWSYKPAMRGRVVAAFAVELEQTPENSFGERTQRPAAVLSATNAHRCLRQDDETRQEPTVNQHERLAAQLAASTCSGSPTA